MSSSKTSSCFLIALMALMTAIQPATAETHTGSNILGLSTQTDETGVFRLVDYPHENLELHLMVHGYEHAMGIKAWDCAVVLPEGVSLERTEFMGRGVNSRPQAGYYCVTTREILEPRDGLIHLATLHLKINSPLPQEFYVAPAPLWGTVGGMEYARATDESLRLNFNWPSGCSECPVFSLRNTILSAEDPSLDWVKSLFR